MSSPPLAALSGDTALAAGNVTKRFGRNLALDDVSFVLRQGTVHALLGENGAGKTTLMNIIFGLTAADSGTVLIRGAARSVASPADAIRAGVGMVHQHFTHVPAMTVSENVSLGGSGRYDARRAAETVISIGERTGLTLDPDARAESLPVGAQQRLEIVKALARGARTLILDEPTAVLAPSEAEELLRWLRDFARSENAVVLITHKLGEALAVADDVTVLRRGRAVHTGPSRELAPRALANLLIGDSSVASDGMVPRAQHETIDSAHASARTTGEVVAALRNTTLLDERNAVVGRDVSIEINAGEIVGIAAVEGAGQREVLRALAGRLVPVGGEVHRARKVAFVPEDRHRDALVLDFSLTENVMLKGAGARRGLLSWRAAGARTSRLLEEYDVRGGQSASPARSLSGGNQQKLVLARELDEAPTLVVAENPTRGLDIRASQSVHARLRDAARSGAGVAFYSSDLDEVLALATRVLVMHAGRLVPSSHDRNAVGRAMLGVA